MVDLSMFPQFHQRDEKKEKEKKEIDFSMFSQIPSGSLVPQKRERTDLFERVVSRVMSSPRPMKTRVEDVLREIPGTSVDLAKKTPEFTKKAIEMFAPAITKFFKTTGGVLGEGLAYAVDRNVREQYQAGNLEVLPTITETTVPDIMKYTIAAGIETAVYRHIPAGVSGNLFQRAGIGGLQGLGFAVAEGLADDKTAEEIVDNILIMAPAGSAINLVAPYLLPILKAEIGKVPKELKNVLKGIMEEGRGTSLTEIQSGQEMIRRTQQIVSESSSVPKPETTPITKTISETPSTETVTKEATPPIVKKVPDTDFKDVTPPKKETHSSEAFSKHYERIKSELGANAEDTVSFSRITIRDEARKAFDYIETSPNDALKVAYGVKKAPSGINAQAVRISMIESLKSSGKLEQARALARRTSLEFTRSAQDLNIAKLDIGTAGARKIEGLILSDQLEKIGKKIPTTIQRGGSAKERALGKIKDDSRQAAKEIISSAKIAYKTADDLLTALTCKKI